MTEAEERQAPLQEKLRTGDPAGDREWGQCPWQRLRVERLRDGRLRDGRLDSCERSELVTRAKRAGKW